MSETFTSKSSYFTRSKSIPNLQYYGREQVQNFDEDELTLDELDDSEIEIEPEVKLQHKNLPVIDNTKIDKVKVEAIKIQHLIELTPDSFVKILQLIPSDKLTDLLKELPKEVTNKIPKVTLETLIPKPVVKVTHLTTANIGKYAPSRDDPRTKTKVVVLTPKPPPTSYSTKSIVQRRRR